MIVSCTHIFVKRLLNELEEVVDTRKDVVREDSGVEILGLGIAGLWRGTKAALWTSAKYSIW